METSFLLLTSNYGLLAHFKKVDKGWVGLHQLFRLGIFKMKTSQMQVDLRVPDGKTLLNVFYPNK